MDQSRPGPRGTTAETSRTGRRGDVARPDEALSAVVHRLRSELDGLRKAMRNRAVIEQAKGVLAARLQVTPEDAFDQLLELSQRTNTKLVEVAAALVGTTAPDPGTPEASEIVSEEVREYVEARRRSSPEHVMTAPPTGEDAQPLREVHSPEREALQSQHQLLASRIATAESYDDMAHVILDTATVWPRPCLVVFGMAELDGALRLVASHGLSPEVRSQWARIPPQVDVPVAAAFREGKAVLLSGDELDEHFPVVRELASQVRALACLPLRESGQVTGVLCVGWDEPMRLTGHTQRYLLALAETCSRALRPVPEDEKLPGKDTAKPPQLALQSRLQHGLLPIVLEPLLDAAAVLSPIVEGDRIVDFEFEYANRAAHELSDAENINLANSTLLETFPEVGSRLLLGEYVRVLQTGQPYQLDDLYIAAEREGTQGSYTFATHAARLGDRVLAVWRIRTDADLLHDQLLRAERIARAGSFWWNLRSGDLRWSPGMYLLLEREPSNGPVGLNDVSKYVHPDDWLGVQNTVKRLIGGRPAELEFRLTGQAAGRRLRLRAEPITADSEVYAISGTVRDVSEERAAEARLRRAEEALAAQRMRLDSERHAAESLRDAVLPGAPDLATTPGLTVRGLCRSPAGAGRVAGDWFDVLSVTGRTILVVGDVAGSGLPATTAAAQLRNAIRAYAVLGLTPGELLAALNTMLCALDPDRLATLVIADFTPKNRRLRWSAAGQAAPVRYSSTGEASVLQGRTGVSIGAVPDATYADLQLAMAPGERLLLYTDGLLSRRDVGAADGLEVLLRVGHDVDLDDTETVVEHVIGKLGSPPHDDLCVVTAQVL